MAEELDFWVTSVVCYVLGANPLLNVIEGFVKCIWNPTEIDKIGIVVKGIYLVRMKTKEGLAVACDSNRILFEKKPFVIKP